MSRERVLEKSERWLFGFAAILLPIAALLAYWPVVHGNFLWDDTYLVLANPLIRSPAFLLEVFRHYLFLESFSVFYRPVQSLSYIFDYWRGGLDPAVYHHTNLLIHGGNAVLLFFLAQRWLGRTLAQTPSFLAAWLLALLWVLHPVHSAIAAYISGRADSLALFFLLASWLCWEKAAAAPQHSPARKWLGWIALSAGLLAMCSKEIAAAGVLLFVLHLWIVRTELEKSFRWRSTSSALAAFGLYLILRNLPGHAGDNPSPPSFPWAERLQMFLRALGDYFRLLIFPDRLFMERQIIPQAALFRNPAELDPLFPWLGWIGAVFLLLLLAAILWPGKGRRLRIFGALWFLVMILPVSNLFALNATVAEHWLYIPSIGFLLVLAGCWVELPAGGRKIAGAALLFAALALAARTTRRAADWTDSRTFFQATIRDGGDSVRMRINLAAEYRREGKPAPAEAIYREVLERMPDYSWVKNLLVTLLLEQGRPAEAASIIRILPNDGPLYIGNLLQSGRLGEALEQGRELYRKQPDSWETVSILADVLEKQHQPDAAQKIVAGFVERHWWHYAAQFRLAEKLLQQGQIAAAAESWQQASRLDIRDVHALNLAAKALAEHGQVGEAIEIQKKAVRRQPKNAQWALLATLYLRNHDAKAAAAAEAHAQQRGE